jgi:gluconokinase
MSGPPAAKPSHARRRFPARTQQPFHVEALDPGTGIRAHRLPASAAMILVVMGVCGCGKTTVGRALAEALDWPFHDADDFHPPANVAKMAAGQPLSDTDRWPWLDRIAAELKRVLASGGHAVLACSALKQAYRDRLQAAGDVRIVYLKGDEATIAARLADRKHQYMPASLLPSQFAALEEPADALIVDIRQPVAAQIQFVRDRLGLTSPASQR